MFKSLLLGLKANAAYLVALAVLSLFSFYALQIFNLNSDLKELKQANSALSMSIINIESDKDKIMASLSAEKLRRESIEASTIENSRLLKLFSESSEQLNNNTTEKQIVIEKVSRGSTNEDCINADMPSSIVGLFDN